MFQKHIVIDGFKLEYYKYIDVSREMSNYEYGPYISQLDFDARYPSRMKLTIETVDGVSITCAPDFFETTEDTIYIYGVLRKMFPSMFADRELLAWQEDYLRDQNKYTLRMRYFRNDPFFDTPEAKLFYSGFKHGKKRGEEQRKGRKYQP